MKRSSFPPGFFRFDFPSLLKMAMPFFFVLCISLVFNEFIMRSIRANVAMNIGIVATACVGVVLIFVRLLNLQADMRALVRFYDEVKAGASMRELIECPWIQSSSILHYLEPIALTDGQISSSLDQNAIERELEALLQEYESETELPQFIVGFLVAMGLLGTFIGLLTTLTGISGMLDGMGHSQDIEKDFAKLIEGLRQPLAGMGIAFSSSMFGLVLSLTLAIMMTMLRRYTSRVMEKARSVMNQLTTRIVVRASQNRGGAIGERGVSGLSGAAGAAMADLGNDISESIASSFAMMSKRFDGLLQSIEGLSRVSEKTNEILGFGAKLSLANERILEEICAINEQRENDEKALRRISNVLVQIEQNLLNTANKDILAVQQEHVVKTGEVFTTLQTVATLLGNLLENQREVGPTLSHVIRSTNDTLLQEMKTMGETQAEGQQTISRIAHGLIQIDQALMANSPQELVNIQNGASTKLGELVAVAQAQISLAGNMLEVHQESNNEVVQSLKGLLGRLTGMETISGNTASILEEIKSDVAGARSSFTVVKHIADQVSDQNLILEKLTRNMKSFEKTIGKAVYIQELSEKEQNTSLEEWEIEPQESDV